MVKLEPDSHVQSVKKVASAKTVDNLSMSLYYIDISDYKDVFLRLHSWPTAPYGEYKHKVKNVGMVEVTGQELDFDSVNGGPKSFNRFTSEAGIEITKEDRYTIQDAYDELAHFYFHENYRDNAGSFLIDKSGRLYSSTTESLKEELGPLDEEIGIPIDQKQKFYSAVHAAIPLGTRAVDNVGHCEIHIELDWFDVPDKVADVCEEAVMEFRESRNGW